MSYEQTLEAVRALAESAVNQPLKRRAAIAPFKPRVVKPAVVPLYPDPTMPAEVQAGAERNTNLGSRSPNLDRFRVSRITGRVFVHTASGKAAFYGGQDERGRIILDSATRRFYVTDEELAIWWKEERTETDNAA